MVSTSVFLAHRQLPSAHEWQRALDGAGLPLQLDTSVTLNDFVGFLPVRYRGQESGFEYFVEHDVAAQIGDALAAARGFTPGLPPDVSSPFGPDTFDTWVTLVARSAVESCTAVAAAAALAALTGGVVHDDAEGQAYAPSDAVAWARRTVAQEDGP